MTAAPRRLRIAQVAPPLERVPPFAYGGTERIVDEVTRELVRRGHEVTVFASGDSDVAPAAHVVTVPQALRPAGSNDDPAPWFAATVDQVMRRSDDFDLVHSHLEWWSLPLARASRIPVVSTFHGRLDQPYSGRLLEGAREGLVAISRHQAAVHPDLPWTVVHNGLTLSGMPFRRDPGEGFCFVGRVDPEKGIVEAIEIALRAGRPLKIAAKIGVLPAQRAYHEEVFLPALRRAGTSVEFLGELAPAERDRLFAESYATLMPGSWPEPFGLVAIESLACGTPIIARRVGALPEIIREGVDGLFGDDAVEMGFISDRVASLDRTGIRARVLERFSAERMTDRYEELYARVLGAPLGLPAYRASLEAGAAVEAPGHEGRSTERQSDTTSTGRPRIAVGPGRPTAGRPTADGSTPAEIEPSRA
ncbi:MAG TPA: glycosyltransferase family 4 protein [Candidatus Limnocylindrales bacterium]|jgi:glycosyltransferase involved in cell wall biosynthesis